jgi:hypothetical protein
MSDPPSLKLRTCWCNKSSIASPKSGSKRNISSNVLIKGKEDGLSLGGWASTTIENCNNAVNNHDAIL